MNASESFRLAMRDALPIDEEFHHTIAQFLFSTNCMVQVWQKNHAKELGI
jgi:hypothetical protein